MSAELALAARIALAGAFGWSAGVKLARPRALAGALAAFGVPAPRVVARGLPPVEAGVAVVLVAVPGEAWPGLAAVGLLAVFTAAVAANLARGRSSPCPCFGVEGSRPLSVATLGRNTVLLALAAVASRSTDGADVAASVVATCVVVPLSAALLRRFG